MDGLSYETIWDGAHRGEDRDLLLMPGIPVKHLGHLKVGEDFNRDTPQVRTRTSLERGERIREAIRACLADSHARTMAAIVIWTGLPPQQVRDGVQSWKRRGRVESIPLARKGKPGDSGQLGFMSYRWVRA